MKPSMAAKPSHFHWSTNNKVTNNNDDNNSTNNDQKQQQQSSSSFSTEIKTPPKNPNPITKLNKIPSHRRNLQSIALSRLRSALSAVTRRRTPSPARVTGTLFGRRRGHVSFALQTDPSSDPSFFVQMAAPISFLVREMASGGLVRIALECDKTADAASGRHLSEEVTWRAYCNGKRCGFATRRGCRESERRVLKAVEMVSMGAGVLPASGGEGKRKAGKAEEGEDEEEVMYMRARFERVVGDRDSEAYYMMNPDSNGAPELSIYLLRV